jgi:hypothetical protein
MDALDKDLMEHSALTEEATNYLRESAKWGRYLAILGFVLMALLVILGFSAGALIAQFAKFPQGQNAGMAMGQMGSFLGILYAAMAAIYFFPTYYLYQFSVKMLNALKTPSTDLLTASFKNLKSMFKFWGIFSIVIMGFYGLVFLIAMIGILAKS